MDRQELTEKHNFINSSIFRLKTLILTGKRFIENSFSSLKVFEDNRELINEQVIAFSESDLWNKFDNKDNWILTAGKIENLRIASKKLNGIEIKANEVFSFWKHIGNPNFGQGYVIGREVREGCIIPTIAGGLCQLSNALYDTALNANFEVVERHRHTKIVKGSLAEQNRDATVKWNYVDLRFKSSYDFRIEVELTSDKLIVSFRSKQKNVKLNDYSFDLRTSNKLNDCYSCGNFACFKHPDRTSKKQEIATTTFILDEKWLEFDDYVNSNSTNTDNFIVPLKKSRFFNLERYSWTALAKGKTCSTTLQGLYRAIKLRYANKNQNNVFELMIQLDKQIANAAVQQIPIDSTHLVISQNLLPFIYETGDLGGRTYDVLMTRLPFTELHERLNFAFSKHPKSSTLNDFRVSKELIQIENKALAKARKIITTHSEIANIFKNKVIKLNWQIPISTNIKRQGNKVLFPASVVGRKGAYEIKRLTRELNLNLVITGNTLENDNFWEDLKPEKFNGNFDQVGLVVYPTYIEHQPRQVLKAISKGIPVITTTACGIDNSEKIKVFNSDDFEGMKNEIKKILSITTKNT